jgi:subtilisin family serine protease
VVGGNGGISVLNEARAIRWAVRNGAKVINLSLGGPRNPNNPRLDTYSALEHAAVDYATRRGVLVVAAAGNCTRVRCPEPYASWPAALPHVLGVAALRPDGQTPSFSNRDRVHVDMAAPGTQMHSTYPRQLTTPGCEPAGYTFCADRASDRNPRGTSFSAPLVTAAAASLLGERGLVEGRLHSSQLRTILERTAADLSPAGRDRRSGFGRLDVARALERLALPLPPRDRYETNDDAGSRSWYLPGKAVRIRGTVDPFDDRRDVYRIPLRAGQRLDVRLNGPERGRSNLYLWRPGTRTLDTGARLRRANRLASSASPGWKERIVHRARARGNHFVEVRLPGGRAGQYTLTILKSG